MADETGISWADERYNMRIAHSPPGEFENRLLALVCQMKVEHATYHLISISPEDELQFEQLVETIFADWIEVDFVDFSTFSGKVQHLNENDMLQLRRLNGAFQNSRIDALMHAVWGSSFQRKNPSVHIGHILPRSRGHMFSTLFPGLNADNLLNLAPHNYLSNIICSNNTLPLPFALYRCYLEVYARISSNMHKINDILCPDPSHQRHAFII